MDQKRPCGWILECHPTSSRSILKPVAPCKLRYAVLILSKRRIPSSRWALLEIIVRPPQLGEYPDPPKSPTVVIQTGENEPKQTAMNMRNCCLFSNTSPLMRSLPQGPVVKERSRAGCDISHMKSHFCLRASQMYELPLMQTQRTIFLKAYHKHRSRALFRYKSKCCHSKRKTNLSFAMI